MAEEIEIDETTVARVGGVRVGAASCCVDDYVRHDGTPARGWVCALAVDGAVGVFVGAGSRVSIAGHPWEVVSVERSPGALGSVRLRRVD